MKIRGKFVVKIDDEIVAEAYNRWTRHFVGELTYAIIAGGYSSLYTTFSYGISHNSSVRVGTDTTTSTSLDMTDLVSKIDTAPNSFTVYCVRTSDCTRYYTQYIAVWQPFVLPSTTIGEIGIYGNLLNETLLTSPAVNPGYLLKLSYNQGVKLLARVSSADGTFSPINYSNDSILRVEYYFEVRF